MEEILWSEKTHGKGKDMASINFTFNGEFISANVPDNTLLVDFIRETLCKTGTHIGCDTSQCGACVIHINSESVKSCTMLAVMANGQEVTTIEGIADSDKMHPMQAAFHENHGLQCGFCTPGMLTTLIEFLQDNPDPTEREVREAISGNLCRCTGYQGIVAAALDAAKRLQARA